MGNAVCWFEIYVQDMQRAKAFYEGVLQVKLQQIPAGIEMWSFAMDDKLAGAGGALVAVPGVASGGNSTVVYFACADCAVEEARVAGYGGTVTRSKMSIGEYGFVSLVKDPDGNQIGLFSQQ